MAVMKVVLDAVFAVPSLGSPILVEDEQGTPRHPQRLLHRAPRRVSLTATRRGLRCAQLLPDESRVRNFQFAVNGFIDLRPHAIVSSASSPRKAR